VSVFCGFMIFSMAGSLPLFMLGAVFTGLGYGLGGAVAMTYLANRWFESGIGSVVGFAAMGSGVASILMPPVVVRIIEASSLSTAFAVEGAIALALGALVFAFLRNRPSDLGLEKFEAKSAKARARHVKGVRPAPAGERRLLLVAMTCVGIFGCCGMTYMSVLATSSGFDALFAALLVSVAGASLTAAKFIGGALFDRLGTQRASALLLAVACVGFGLCSLAGLGNRVVMVVGSAAIGAGLSLGTVGLSMWSIDLSDPTTRTRQIRNFQVAYALGGFIANTLPGIVKDLVGSYAVSYAAMVVVAAFAAFVILRFYRKFAVYE
jgi:sugar phosphate permease